jgi:hypothetical protein
MNARTGAAAAARSAVMVLVLGGAQCAKQQPGQPTESDSARVARLEREARAMASAEGCSAADQCRTAPVGDRPCGGPRAYIVYCARTTDSLALHRKLAELIAAERELNEKTGAMSTCEFRLPPQVELVGGSCRASGR